VAFLAVLLVGGAAALPLNTRLAPPEPRSLLDDADVAGVLAKSQSLPQGRPVLVWTGPDELAEVFYTSGTTGRPKGVMITHRALLTAVEAVAAVLKQPTDGVPALVAVPLFHVMGVKNLLLPTWRVGGTAVVLPGFTPAAFVRALAEERIDAVTAVPAIYFAVLNDPSLADVDTSGVRWLAYGAAATASGQVERLASAFPAASLATGYGMTELTGGVTNLPHEFAWLPSVGYPLPGVDLALRDVDPDTQTGELVVRSAQVMRLLAAS
jgi:acyl-CoA synthetase (AMP-forming)/AMP-acid ligase II